MRVRETKLTIFSIILIACLAFPLILKGQCPTFDFTLPPSVCLNENFKILNTSPDVNIYDWDLCSGDLLNSSAAQELTVLTNISAPRAITTVANGDDVISFIVGENNRFLRVRFLGGFGGTIEVSNFQNIGGLLSIPRGLTYVKENDKHYVIVANQNGTFVLVDFDSDLLMMSPTATMMTNIPTMSSVVGLEFIESQNSKILYAVGVGAGNRQLVIIDLGTSIFNPSPTTSTSDFPSATGLSSISLIKECDNWYGIMTSFINNKYYKLFFGSDPASLVSSEELLGITAPLGAQLRWVSGKFYGFISTNSGELYRLNFGSDFSVPGIEASVNLTNYGLLSQSRAFNIMERSGREYALSVGYGDKKVSLITFQENCGLSSNSIIKDTHAPVIFYESPGNFMVTGILYDGSSQIKRVSKSITVNPLAAPDISFNSQNICANNDVIFTSENISGDITDYNWDFDDTNTSMAQNPIHQFTAAGDYEVKLQVTASNGCNNLASETVTIYNEPVADFDLPSTSPICTNQEYTFDNTTSFDAGSNPSWQWEINGTPTSTVEDLTYQIPTATMQDIKLIASIPGCSSEVTKTINTVEDGPLADFSFVNDCEDRSITFTNTTVGTVTGYSWDFGDGNTSGLTNGTNTFDDFGTYDVTLEATNAAGCINTSVQEITIYSKPQPDFSLDLPPFSCNGSPSQFNDLTPNPADSNLDSWTWSFGDTQSGTSITRNPQYIYTDAGQYNVNLDVTTNFGCAASIQKLVTISQTPDANFAFNAACVNQATSFVPQSTSGIDSWQWKVGVSTYNQQNPTHVFSTPANYNVQLTANGSNGCIGVASQTINVPAPSTVDFNFENNCTDQNTRFTDLTSVGVDPVSLRSWQFGTIGTASGAAPSFIFPTAGSYPTKLTVTNESGCSYSTTKIVNITQSPVVTFTATPQTGTPPLTVQLNNISENSVSQLWSVNDTSNASSTEKSATFTFEALGEYVVDLTIQDESGCSSISSKIISVIIPTLDIELTDLSLIPTATGESNILLTLKNKSNFPVNNIKAVVDIEGEALISETLTATVQPGEIYSQVLSAGIIDPNNRTSYLCVELLVDGDADVSNNKQCLNNDAATVVIAPYPNPGSENLNLDWISPATGMVEISIFDPTGRKVYESMLSDLEPGLNKATISVSLLNPGMYYVFFVSEGVRRSFPFVIRR